MSGLLGCTEVEQQTGSNLTQIRDVTSQEAFNLIKENKGNPNFIILDVRTAAEFDSGHIAGAINIDVNFSSFPEEIKKLNTVNTYLVYCRSGNRSRKALTIMEELRFTSIYHLANGITEWINSGLPVVQ
ncbi:MAG: rhodanese-like domain-containing protein [Chloroflexota bacterium]